METMKRTIIILIHAIIGWALCGSIIGIGRSLTSMDNTLIIHAIVVPVIFVGISTIYFKKFNFTKPIITGIIFLCFIVFMDFFVIAILVEKSLDMFKSILGTWIPFALIFISTYLTGRIINSKN
jgi:hypothetical protein